MQTHERGGWLSVVYFSCLPSASFLPIEFYFLFLTCLWKTRWDTAPSTSFLDSGSCREMDRLIDSMCWCGAMALEGQKHFLLNPNAPLAVPVSCRIAEPVTRQTWPYCHSCWAPFRQWIIRGKYVCHLTHGWPWWPWLSPLCCNICKVVIFLSFPLPVQICSLKV